MNLFTILINRMETTATFSQFRFGSHIVPNLFNTDVISNNTKYKTYSKFSLIKYAKNIDKPNNICKNIETNCCDNKDDEYYMNLYECLKIAKNKHNIYPIYPIVMQIKKDISEYETKSLDFVVLNNGVIFSNTFLKSRNKLTNIFAIKNVYENDNNLYICNLSCDVNDTNVDPVKSHHDDNNISKKMYVLYKCQTPMLSTIAIDKIRLILSNEFTNDSLNKIKICIIQDRIMMNNPINYYDRNILDRNIFLSSQNKELLDEAFKLKEENNQLKLKKRK